MGVAPTSKVVRIRGVKACKCFYQKTGHLNKWEPGKYKILPYLHGRFPERKGQWLMYLSWKHFLSIERTQCLLTMIDGAWETWNVCSWKLWYAYHNVFHCCTLVSVSGFKIFQTESLTMLSLGKRCCNFDGVWSQEVFVLVFPALMKIARVFPCHSHFTAQNTEICF